MSETAEKLRQLSVWLLSNDIDMKMPEGMIDPEVGADEIDHLRAEVERLNKSRNKWGQKYNKLLEKHKVTVSQLKAAVWSDSEECRLLTAENERLREVNARNNTFTARVDELDNLASSYLQAAKQVGGCADGNCVVLRPTGMHTNGGCRCTHDMSFMRELRVARLLGMAQHIARSLLPSESGKKKGEGL
jgi:hypothetical protein